MGHLTYNNGVVVVGKDVCSSSSNLRNFQSVVVVQKFVRRCGQFLERESRRSSSPRPWSPLEAVLCQNPANSFYSKDTYI